MKYNLIKKVRIKLDLTLIIIWILSISLLVLGSFSGCTPDSDPLSNFVPNLSFKADGLTFVETSLNIPKEFIKPGQSLHTSECNRIEKTDGTFFYRFDAFCKPIDSVSGMGEYVRISLNTDPIIINKVYDCIYLGKFIAGTSIHVFGKSFLNLNSRETECKLIITAFDGKTISGTFSFINLYSDYVSYPKVNITDGVFTNINYEQ